MKLEIDSEKVLALAAKCPKWKEGLVELFPEAFKSEIPAVVGGAYSIGEQYHTYVMGYVPISSRVFFFNPKTGCYWGNFRESPEDLIKAYALDINEYLGKIFSLSTEKQ